MDEYQQAEAVLYDTFQTGIEGDVAFYVAEAQRAGSPILELGCGTGRILLPIAEAGGTITGLDRSAAMLAIAREKLSQQSAHVQQRVDLVEGDMRTFSIPQRFQLVIIPYRAFLHMLTVEDQRQALQRISEHLVNGGRLILNVFDPKLETIVAMAGSQSGTLRWSEEIRHPRTGRKVVVWNSRRYYPEEQRVEQLFIFEELDEAGNVVAKSYAPLTARWIYQTEMQHLLELSGYQIEALYGDFQRGPFRYGGEQIWVARKK
jgi:ubiquinone/menaquinone biosynthesis C-methylase UbiE